MTPEASSDWHPRLRRFALTDMAAVLDIETKSFPDDPYPEGLFASLHRRSPALFLVALDTDRITGYVVATIEERRGRIISIAVDPPARRRGVARDLCDEILRRLVSSGVTHVDLETRRDNDAGIRLWKALGFQPTGILPFYYEGGADALTMRWVRDAAIEPRSA